MRAYVLLAVSVIVALVTIQHNAEVDVRQSDLASCERGNEIRLTAYVSARAGVSLNRRLVLSAESKAEGAAYLRAYNAATNVVNRTLAAARDSGHQLAEGSPLVDCESAIPEADWWPL